MILAIEKNIIMSNKSQSPIVRAPEFNIDQWIDKNGIKTKPIKLSDFKGRFKVLLCFQSWCPGCHSKGLPHLKKLVEALDGSSVSRVLKMAAPVVMGLLGKQQREQNASNTDENGISNTLMSLVGATSENNNQSFFESILDADNDGSIIDDVAEVISDKKKNGIAGVFGKLFNKN